MIRRSLSLLVLVAVSVGFYFLLGTKASITVNFFDYQVKISMVLALALIIASFLLVFAVWGQIRDVYEGARRWKLRSEIKRNKKAATLASKGIKGLALGDRGAADAAIKSLRSHNNFANFRDWVGYLIGLAVHDFDEAKWRMERLKKADEINESEALELERRMAREAGDKDWLLATEARIASSNSGSKVLSLPAPVRKISKLDPLKDGLDLSLIKLRAMVAEKDWKAALKMAKQLSKESQASKSDKDDKGDNERLLEITLIEIEALIEIGKKVRAKKLMEKQVELLKNHVRSSELYLLADDSNTKKLRLEALQRWHLLTNSAAGPWAAYVTELLQQEKDSLALPLLRRLSSSSKSPIGGLSNDQRLMVINALLQRRDESMHGYLLFLSDNK